MPSIIEDHIDEIYIPTTLPSSHLYAHKILIFYDNYINYDTIDPIDQVSPEFSKIKLT